MATETEPHLLAMVGQLIRANRAEQALSLDQLARLTGVSAPALSLIETGKRDVRLSTLAKIAGALRVPLATLVAVTAPDAPSSNPQITDPQTAAPARGYDLEDYQ